MEQSFGAVIAIGIGATGLMGLPLALADYRHKKVLKRFVVTPVSPAVLLFVQFFVNLLVSLLCLVMFFFSGATLPYESCRPPCKELRISCL